MIKHNENTFSILGHLKQNSIGVKVGDIVNLVMSLPAAAILATLLTRIYTFMYKIQAFSPKSIKDII
jgi:hypothetical protein